MNELISKVILDWPMRDEGWSFIEHRKETYVMSSIDLGGKLISVELE